MNHVLESVRRAVRSLGTESNNDPQLRRILLAIASPLEAQAVLNTGTPNGNISGTFQSGPWKLESFASGFDVVVTGVGKANAAAGVARVIDSSRHCAVISLGIAGTLPNEENLNGEVTSDANNSILTYAMDIGDVVVANVMRYADEGLERPEGFVSLSEMGFPIGPFDEGKGVLAPKELTEVIAELLRKAGCACQVGVIATVSTCSGTNALARQVVARTGAVAEAMEGAAVCQVAAWFGISSCEIRVISNTTGSRSEQRWDVGAAMETLSRIGACLRG